MKATNIKKIVNHSRQISFEWRAGIYDKKTIIHFQGNLYTISATLPFRSVDFQQELLNGEWQVIFNNNPLIIVLNYSALPLPQNALTGKIYLCLESQGIKWLPGSLGGTYYPNGFYYSNGTIWIYSNSPFQSTQNQVDEGINNETFVTPLTLRETNKRIEIVGELNQVNFILPTTAYNIIAFNLNGVDITESAYNFATNVVTYIPANNGNNQIKTGDSIKIYYN